MNKVLIIDTSILCVWLKVPGKETCGTGENCWGWNRVNAKIEEELRNASTLVLPLASIIETGNHISQSAGDRYTLATRLGEVMEKAASETSPWAAFSHQSSLWSPANLHKLAREWPSLASRRLSIGDATIKQVAEYYAETGFSVEILTGDEGLKAYEPTIQIPIPRRRK